MFTRGRPRALSRARGRRIGEGRAGWPIGGESPSFWFGILHPMPGKTSTDIPEPDPSVSAPSIPKKIQSAYLTALRGGALPGEGDDMDGTALADASAFVAGVALDRPPGQPVLALEPMAADGTDRRMRLPIVNDDMPFLVDSTSQVAAAQGLAHRESTRLNSSH